MTGVYLIRNKFTDECYIGQSVNIEARWNTHKNSLNKKQYALYTDMRFYGVSSFEFSVIEICSKAELDEREMFWIKKYQENGFKLYNIIGVAAKEAAYAFRYRGNKKPFKKNR